MRLSLLFVVTAIFIGCTPPNPAESTTNNQPKATDAAEISEDEPSGGTDEDEPAPGDTNESPVFVIDVRTQREWDAGHVSQAVHIPHTEISDRISEVTEDKAAKIVLYCAVGGRAGIAKTKLEELGYTNIENAGGYDDVKERFE